MMVPKTSTYRKLHNFRGINFQFFPFLLTDSAMNIGGNMWKFVMDYLHRKRGNGEEEDREEGEGEEGEAIAEGGGGGEKEEVK